MFSYADTDQRSRFIAGLHALASYLADHPAIPVPCHGADILFNVDIAEDGGCLQVRQIARQLAVTVSDETRYGGHCTASKSFGPISYTVVSIPNSRMARLDALWSYYGCVQPDNTPRGA